MDSREKTYGVGTQETKAAVDMAIIALTPNDPDAAQYNTTLLRDYLSDGRHAELLPVPSGQTTPADHQLWEDFENGVKTPAQTAYYFADMNANPIAGHKPSKLSARAVAGYRLNAIDYIRLWLHSDFTSVDNCILSYGASTSGQTADGYIVEGLDFTTGTGIVASDSALRGTAIRAGGFENFLIQNCRFAGFERAIWAVELEDPTVPGRGMNANCMQIENCFISRNRWGIFARVGDPNNNYGAWPASFGGHVGMKIINARAQMTNLSATYPGEETAFCNCEWNSFSIEGGEIQAMNSESIFGNEFSISDAYFESFAKLRADNSGNISNSTFANLTSNEEAWDFVAPVHLLHSRVDALGRLREPAWVGPQPVRDGTADTHVWSPDFNNQVGGGFWAQAGHIWTDYYGTRWQNQAFGNTANTGPNLLQWKPLDDIVVPVIAGSSNPWDWFPSFGMWVNGITFLVEDALAGSGNIQLGDKDNATRYADLTVTGKTTGFRQDLGITPFYATPTPGAPSPSLTVPNDRWFRLTLTGSITAGRAYFLLAVVPFRR